MLVTERKGSVFMLGDHAMAVLSCSTEVSSSREEVVTSAASDRWRAALRTDHKIDNTNSNNSPPATPPHDA
jgi:hypothetical protein